MERPFRILVVMGSPRKGNTYRAAERIRELMEAHGPVDFEYLWLRDSNLVPCRGCFLCIEKGEERCPNEDDAPAIEQRMREADGVIFASPVYGMNVSGLFKNFVDRFCYIFHRPRFFDKKALLLTTAGGVGTKEVQSYLSTVAEVWGFEVAGRAGLIVPPGAVPEYRKHENERILATAAGSFCEALRSGRRRSPRLKDVIIFRAQRGTFGELEQAAPVDFRYWKEQGWLEPGCRYYADVPVNPVYSAIGRLVERQARRQIRKDISP
ncbi:MAG: flavodoxin family protein [Methanospirillum sp.]